MTEMTDRSRRFTPVQLFFLLSLAGIVVYFVYAFFYGNEAATWLAMESDTSQRFMDFFMHIKFVSDPKNVYTTANAQEGCFPPLAYCMYYFLYRIGVDSDTETVWMADFEANGDLLNVYQYYAIFVALMFFIGISMVGRQCRKLDVLLIVSLLLSTTFFQGGYEKGNSTMLVLSLLLIALAMKDSKSAAQREAALILIAVCAGLKIYPAVFGLLYLKEGRYKEALRLTIYGIVLFCVPFAFFGGIAGFRAWLSNIVTTMGFADYGRIQYIKGAVYSVLYWLTGQENTMIVSLVPWIFFVIMVVLAWLSRSRYRTLFFLAAIIVFFPSNCYRYTLCYLTIPLIFYIKEYDGESCGGKDVAGKSGRDKAGKRTPPDGAESQTSPAGIALPSGRRDPAEEWITMALYGLLFSIPMLFGFLTGFELNFEVYTLTYVEVYIYMIAYLMLAWVVIMELRSLITERKVRAAAIH